MAADKHINKQLERTVKDSLVYLPARIVPAIIGIALIRILSTVFTPEDYGYYQIALSTFGLIRVFSMIWLSTSVTRFYLKHKQQSREELFFSTLLFTTLTSALFVAALSLILNTTLLAASMSENLTSLINLVIAASIFNTVFEVFVVIFRAGLQPKLYTLYWVIFSVGKPVIGVLLIYVYHFRAAGIFWGFLIAPMILDVILFFKLRLHHQVKIRFFSYPLLKRFFKYGVPISMSFFAFWILTLSDRYLLGYFRGGAEVGLYSVGYTISEKTLNFIYMILMLAAYPIIIDNYEEFGDERAQQLITELTRYFFLICTPVMTVLVVMPRDMFLIFSDAKFIDGARVLPLIAAAVFLFGLNQYVLKGFELHQKSLRIAQLALIAGSVNILSNLILIPRMGYIGAGISALVAYVVYFMSSIYFARMELAWRPPLRSIIRILSVALLILVSVKGLSIILPTTLIRIVVLVPLTFILFYGLLIVIKEIDMREIKAGWTFIQKRFQVPR